MNIQKELQNKIGELIGKDYSEYERECDCPSREEIIVKPEPSLNDVLMAIGKNENYTITDMKLAEKGKVLAIRIIGETLENRDIIFRYYDLSKSFFNQSEETLQAIYNLLK